MSRIDEALRRAEREEVDDPRPASLTVDRPLAGASDLDRYSTERPVVRQLVREHRQPPPPVEAPRPRSRTFKIAARLRGKLALTRDMDPVALEQYRRLAGALEEAQAARNIRCLMISSAVPQEGKTLTSTNLALTLSESYKRRVLLIDADFRRPGVHEVFGVPNDGGLAALLRSGDSACRPIELTPTLSILTAGRIEGSPTAALSSEGMKAVVANAVSRFDWVLIDTPPVGLLTDAQLVARISDGVLLVIAAGVTPYPLVQRTIAEFGADRILGTVLNRVGVEALPAQDYYGRYYQEQS